MERPGQRGIISCWRLGVTQENEHCQLQAVLCSIPELLDDFEALQDMRVVFRVSALGQGGAVVRVRGARLV